LRLRACGLEVMGKDRAGRYHIDPDALIGVVKRRDLGQPDNPGLAGHVGRQIRGGIDPGDRRHVHDRPAASGQHGWDLELHAEKRAADVGGDAAVELGHVDLGQRRWQRPVCGVVECRVESAVTRDRLIDQVVHRISVRDVAADRESVAAAGFNPLRDGLKRCGVAGSEHDGGARSSERLGCGGADAPACPSDQCDPSLHRKFLHGDLPH
jgi:hypothetical protein